MEEQTEPIFEEQEEVMEVDLDAQKAMRLRDLLVHVTEQNPKAVVLPQFYDALVGILDKPDTPPVLLYSRELIIHMLVEVHSIAYADAVVYFDEKIYEPFKETENPSFFTTVEGLEAVD